MATKTPKLNLNKPGAGEYGWDAALNANADVLDAAVGTEHNAAGKHTTINPDKVGVGGKQATATGEVAADRVSVGTTPASQSGEVRAQSITLGGVNRTTWPAPGNATAALTDVLTNGPVGNIPAGQQFALRDSTGTTTHFSVDEATGAVTLGALLRNRVLASIASAATLDLSSATGANANLLAQITGTANISAVTMDAGSIVEAIAGGAFTLVNGSYLIVEGGANYTCAVGDRLTFINFDGATTYVFIKKVNGTPVKALGVGQTWQNMSASRTFGVNYTNNTTNPICVKVSALASANSVSSLVGYVDGIIIEYSGADYNGRRPTVGFIVPAGSVYQVSASSTGTISLVSWAELR